MVGIVGIACFGVALDSVLLLVTDVVSGSEFAAGATAGVAALVLVL